MELAGISARDVQPLDSRGKARNTTPLIIRVTLESAAIPAKKRRPMTRSYTPFRSACRRRWPTINATAARAT